MGKKAERGGFNSDRPIASRDQDRLLRTHFANALAKAIRSWKGRDSLVIGLHGPWGSGKSSLKNLALEVLRSAKSTCPMILEFNPWQWSGQDQLNLGFFRELALALGEADKSPEGQKRAEKLAFYGNLMSMGGHTLGAVAEAMATIGIPGSPIAKGASTALTRAGKFIKKGSDAEQAGAKLSEKSAADLKRELTESLRSLKKPLLVVMDDVDRLMPAEIRLLLQLVKVNADFPNVVYLVLFQRNLVEEALTEANLHGRDFLEKIVQVSFDLPALDPQHLERHLQEGLGQVYSQKGDEKRWNKRRWGNIYYGGLGQYFENLRDINRFISSLSFHVELFRDGEAFEANPVDLVAMETLRLFEPTLFQAMAGMRGLLTGSDPVIRHMEDNKRWQREIDALLAHASKDRVDAVKGMFRFLFPLVAHLVSKDARYTEIRHEWRRELRVCHPDVFSRYFHFALPPGEISQSDIDLFLASTGNRENLVKHLRGMLDRGLLDVFMDRMEAYVDTLDVNDAVPIITAICDLGDELSNQRQNMFEHPPAVHAYRIVYFLLRRIKQDADRYKILDQAIRASDSAFLPAKIVAREYPDKAATPTGPEEPPLVTSEDLDKLRSICLEKIRSNAGSMKFAKSANVVRMLYIWRGWAGDVEVRNWCAGFVQNVDGALALLAGHLGQLSGGPVSEHVVSVRWYVRLGDIEQFASLETLKQTLQAVNRVKLSERQVLALKAFEEAVERRERGKPDDPTLRDDDDE